MYKKRPFRGNKGSSSGVPSSKRRRTKPAAATVVDPASSVVNIAALHDARMDALLRQRDVELPEMRALLVRFENVLRGSDELSDAMANLVFKDHELLRNYRAKEKFRRKRANGEISSASNKKVDVDDTLASEHNVPDDAYARIEAAAKEHLNRLRRLKGKSGARLTIAERFAILDFILVKRQWCDDVESGRELLEYVFETRDLMDEYACEMKKVDEYIDDEQRELNRREDQPIEFLSSSSKTPLDCLLIEQPPADDNNNNDSDEDNSSDEDEDEDDEERPPPATAALDSIIIESDVYRSLTELQTRYFALANIRRNDSTHAKLNVRAFDVPYCVDCHVELVVETSSATQTCPRCGVSQRYQDMSLQNVPYGEPFNVVKPRSSYEKRTYYEKWIKSVSGALNGQIPEDVWARLYRECVSRKWATVTKQMIRLLLKQLRLSEYYIYASTITNEFNGIPLILFSAEEKAALDNVFEEALVLFDRCPQHIKRRSNFISYSYFFFQACSMLGYTEYAPVFKLLSGHDYLKRHDRIWRWMCDNKTTEPRWTFFPSV